MKFFTRELFDAIQCEPDTPESEAADASWKSQCAAYQEHLEFVRSSLPQSMQTFCDTSLHDGVVKACSRPSADVVELEIDASHNPWGPRGYFQLRFSGVKDVTQISSLLGEWWLYEEVHLHPNAGFEFRVLLTRGEFRVAADKVELLELSPPKGSGT